VNCQGADHPVERTAVEGQAAHVGGVQLNPIGDRLDERILAGDQFGIARLIDRPA
jgi:hypothetical protein